MDAAKKFAEHNPVFVMARDITSKISLDKHRDVFYVLKHKFGAKRQCYDPESMGLEGFVNVSPAIDVVLYIMQSANFDDIHAALKSVIYKPAKGAKKDMFRLEKHGLLLAD